MSQSHDDLRALAPGYVLGILDLEERRLFEPHLEECPECAAEVRALLGAVDALARSVPQQAPPADLRQRVMASVLAAESSPGGQSSAGQSSAPANPWANRRVWLPAAASVLIALGAGIYGSHLHVEVRLAALSERAEATDREIAAALRAAVDARSAMEIITAPNVVQFDLQGQGDAAGRALWSRQHGMVFAGTNLPAPPAGQCYQVWILTAGTTISAGILPESGSGLAVFETPPDLPQPASVAVTLEPLGGATAPTGARVLAASVRDRSR